MKVRGSWTYAVIALAGVAACAAPPLYAGGPITEPVAVAGTPEPTRAAGPAQPSAPATPTAVPETPADPVPIPEPTVAKRQKWVKIYSGPAVRRPGSQARPGQGGHSVELVATTLDRFGQYVTDGSGRTLYRFDRDSAKPPTSTCNGDCAKAWPPLLIKSPGKIYPKGLNPKILGYLERADGHCQVTINGHPVYYYSGDRKPGDLRGQGLQGVWFAVTPTGGRTLGTL